MKLIMIDDEAIAIDVLRIMLERFTQFPISIEGAFTKVEDGFRLLEQQHVDVVFLDIDMIDMHGVQVAKQIVKRFPTTQIIFVTAHSQFAVDAFDIEATDYLLKPVAPKRLHKALQKAYQKCAAPAPAPAAVEHRLFVHTLGTFYLMNDKHDMVKWRTKKTRELFLYLWVHQQKPILNTAISEVLWPEMEYEKALTNLHTAVYYLRQLFKANGFENAIQLVNNHYMLTANVQSDFEELMQLLHEPPSQSQIERIMSLYEGDFLEEADFQWAMAMQGELKEKVLATLETFAQQSYCTSALQQMLYKKMLDLDEYNERYMLRLMELYAEQQKRAECMQLYKVIRERLELELYVPIPQSIQQIYARAMQE